MKKLLLTICSSLFCVLSYAQTEHLTFKGLPIDGSKQEFVKELQRQGYVYVDDDILSGTFIGRDSYVFIYDTPITNTVRVPGIKNRGIKKCKAKDNQIIIHFSSVPLF